MGPASPHRDLLVGDPAAVEAGRDLASMRTHATGWPEKSWAARMTRSVALRLGLDEGHNVAVVFGGVGVAGAKTVSPAVGSLPNWCAWTVPAARSR